MLGELTTLVQVIVHVGGQSTKQFFANIAPTILSLLMDGRPAVDYRCGISALTDVIEQFGEVFHVFSFHV